MPIFNRLSRSVQKPKRSGVLAVRYDVPERGRHSPRPKKKRRGPGSRGADDDGERFSDYLSSGMRGGRSRAQRPQVERNQILLLAVLIAMAVFAILYRLL